MNPVLRWTLLGLFSPVLLPALPIAGLIYLLMCAIDGRWL
jgi:hypothetical protein